MHVDFQLNSLSGLFARASSLRGEYAAAKPWPHIVVNDAFPEKLLDTVAAECTALQEARLVTTNTDRLVKQEVSDGLGPATQHLLSLVDSARFREFISAVTGVRDLHSDPTHKFAGVHRTPPGGFTKIHRDFEAQPTTGLFHRAQSTHLSQSGLARSLRRQPRIVACGHVSARMPHLPAVQHQDPLGDARCYSPRPSRPGLLSPWSNAPSRRIILLHDDAPRRHIGRTPRAVLGSATRRNQWIERMSWQDHLRALIPDPLHNVLRAARGWISRAHRSRTR